MTIINQLEQTGYACPSQWDGYTIDGDNVYIRVRHGRLTVSINDAIVYEAYPDDVDGVMSQDEMIYFINSNAQDLMIDL